MPETLVQLKNHLLRPASDGSNSALSRLLSAFSVSKSEPSPPKSFDGINASCNPARQVAVHGVWGSLPRLLAVILAQSLSRPILYITAHITEADAVQDDLQTLTEQNVFLLPAAEIDESQSDPFSEISCERLRICQYLSNSYRFPYKNEPFPAIDQNSSPLPPNLIISASIQALMQPVPSKYFLSGQSFHLTVDQEIPGGPNTLIQWLLEHNFNRVDQVDVMGDFACRGGIIDIFMPSQDLSSTSDAAPKTTMPLRVEFFGDQIESLRLFDLDTQRSLHSINRINITGGSNPKHTQEKESFLNYLPPPTLLIIEEYNDIIESGKIVIDRLSRTAALYPVEMILKQIQNFDTLFISRFPWGDYENSLSFGAQSVQRFENQSTNALAEILDSSHDNEIYFFCENPAERQRTTEIISYRDKIPTNNPTAVPVEKTLPPHFHLPLGFVHHGFDLPKNRLLILTHHEVFGQHQIRRHLRKIQSTHTIESFTDLTPGDSIVHLTHGIGLFRGMKTLTKTGRQEEYLALEFANRAVIHVPASNIDLVHKYVGCLHGKPKLSRLGSGLWEKQKQKVSAAVEDLAGELIDLQARRQTSPGIAYPPDTIWQHEFEDSFPYQETDDQITANLEIKQDMTISRPMDRLLCGDVGFGKTELALRAAFKAVEHGKQVALLVPTTILAQQHYRTFTQRLAGFPFIIEVLSRFKSPKQAKDIIARAAQGRTDILIGTHRLLSPDVHFKDLGLIIIDEEQRFGVEHKERLKRMRETVDILTMTATPIPRTLHMALLGIRDISSLTTPPLDRRSILTEVCSYDRQRIKQIILRELSREGQVYFVHNRVHNIFSVADNIRRLVPEARVLVAHGQMPKHELERCMIDFVNYRADVLVCTTIIESGLDIPNANTIIINDADRFGLAELHQLRGRVGRYKNRAFAYMLLPIKRHITANSLRRLKAIEEYSQLGCGFRIALRDLEIRGAGNILGLEQSGHIDAVGYELYCRLLATAVRRLRCEPEPQKIFTHLELNISSNIPRSYIPSDRQRMDVYRRLLSCVTAADLQLLEKDLFDQFGELPSSMQLNLQLAQVRILASSWSIRSLVQQKPDLIFSLMDGAKISPLFDGAPGSIRIPDERTIHLRLPAHYFNQPSTILAILRKMLAK